MQEPRPAGPAALRLEADPRQPPSPAATMLAYKLVEPWVRAWAMPPQEAAAAATDEQGRPLPPVYGACVNLRLHGQLIGRGQSLAFAADDKPDTGHIVRAVAAAITDADPRLPVANDLNRDAAVKLLTPDIQISLELAGAPTLITDDTWTLVDTGLAPGLDGLACRAGKGDEEVAFPSAMMMGNLLPQRVLRGMIANAIGEGGAAEALLAPKLIRDKHVLTMASFRVSHLAQCAPGRGPEFLYRGSRLRTGVPNTTELREMAVQLALNLTRRWANDATREPVYTSYQPWNDKFEAGERATAQLLLATGALFEFGDGREQLGYTGLPPAPYEVIHQFFERAGACDWKEPQSGVEWGLAVMARGRIFPEPKSYDLTTACALGAVTNAIRETATGQRTDTSGMKPVRRDSLDATRFERLSPLEQSVLLGVLARSSYAKDVDNVRNQERCIRQVFATSRPEQLVALMPWLGWAEVRTSDLRPTFMAQPDLTTDTQIPSAPALRQMRAEVWKHQLSVLDAGTDGTDMVGGIVFTSGPSTPFPTWQTVRPIAFIATMLGDDRLTEPAERDIELFRLLQAFRFLRQLQVDDSCGWMCPNPEAAIGGIRAATWDQSMPPDATSLTLLATCELLKSMDKLAAAEADQSKPKDEPAAAP